MSGAGEPTLDDRFGFGENWSRFLAVLNEERIREAERAFTEVLGEPDLAGLSVLDVGSGSGLSSLVARRLGGRVRSFDFDPASVACTRELRRRYYTEDPHWTVERGSALDAAFMEGLGSFDLVYAWGVLHHTGDMWRALELAAARVAPGGRFFVAIYNDRGLETRMWWHVKRIYNALPTVLRPAYAALAMAPYEARRVAGAVLRGRFGEVLGAWTGPSRRRGMSRWHDIVDWVGGFPYEAATLGALEAFLGQRGFTILNTREARGLGCHEIVACRSSTDGARA